MFGLSNDQIMGLLRQVLPVIGGIGVTLGWVTTDQVAAGTQFLLQIASPLAIIVGLTWSLIANMKSSILQSAAQMPDVRAIVMEPTPDGHALAASVPHENVVPAGKEATAAIKTPSGNTE